MIKLLIVDDSPLMRRLLSGLFGAAGDFEVDVARDGQEALAKLERFAPDVITLDIHMPGMDGLACLDRIMLERPTPIVMVSSLSAEGASETLDAMALGAIDFIAKPTGAVSLEIDKLAPLLIEKVRAAARARLPRTHRLAERIRAKGATAPAPAPKLRKLSPTVSSIRDLSPIAGDGLLLVGCSTGGPTALEVLLKGIPSDFPWPILIAQHMPLAFTGPLARRLDGVSALSVSEISRATPLQPGHAYIGRGDADLVVARRAGQLVAMAAPSSPDFHWHPSVDRLVASAMDHIAPERLVGVLMTGMGSDGAKMMAELRQRGGFTLAKSEDTAVIWGMPGSLAALGGASLIAPLDTIAPHVVTLIGAR